MYCVNLTLKIHLLYQITIMELVQKSYNFKFFEKFEIMEIMNYYKTQ